MSSTALEYLSLRDAFDVELWRRFRLGTAGALPHLARYQQLFVSGKHAR